MADPTADRAAAGTGTAGEAGRPAYYAARPGRWRDWWTLLHPPYTAWHLSYVVIGASLAPRVSLSHLLYAVAAFFLAVGVAAHALDELHGRPLRTAIPAWALVAATVVSLAGAVGLGIYGITQTGWLLLPFMVAGPALVVAYNMELFDGIIHNDVGFAAAWGAFPALTGYVAQDGTLGLAAVAAAGAALALSAAQRRLSTPARTIRRRAVRIDGTMRLADGTVTPLGAEVVLAPLEGALRAMSWGLILLAAALAIARLR
ncbi:MAG TPA: hypothetical protein VG268_22345 [Streptosporangiaceae bacterium]|nr:hypothetical protein [Streptosporangiaceae bacterium]